MGSATNVDPLLIRGNLQLLCALDRGPLDVYQLAADLITGPFLVHEQAVMLVRSGHLRVLDDQRQMWELTGLGRDAINAAGQPTPPRDEIQTRAGINRDADENAPAPAGYEAGARSALRRRKPAPRSLQIRPRSPT